MLARHRPSTTLAFIEGSALRHLGCSIEMGVARGIGQWVKNKCKLSNLAKKQKCIIYTNICWWISICRLSSKFALRFTILSHTLNASGNGVSVLGLTPFLLSDLFRFGLFFGSFGFCCCLSLILRSCFLLVLLWLLRNRFLRWGRWALLSIAEVLQRKSMCYVLSSDPFLWLAPHKKRWVSLVLALLAAASARFATASWVLA